MSKLGCRVKTQCQTTPLPPFAQDTTHSFLECCVADPGNFQNAYPELVNLKSYSIKGSKHEEGVHKVLVEVTGQNQRGPNSQFVFVLAEKGIGAKIGALMTRCLIRHEQA